MRSIILSSILLASLASLSACGDGNKEDNQVTRTRMEDIDSLEGTISDDMINTDESADEGPYDAAPAADGKVSAPAKDDKKAKEDDDKAEAKPVATTDEKAADE
ncbi:MAG: hypothetical protein ABI668_08905 [Sphingorhabdus sp.]